VHDRTSREIFGPLSILPPDEQRRVSKMVNYALLYGKTAFTLAKDLDVPRKQAEEFIAAYFARYSDVRRFIDETIAAAKREGSVRTLLGRRRALPEIASRNRALRQAAERMAVNTVIQGTAADLIKKAMLAVSGALRADGSGAHIILQVHDELVIEVPEGEAERVRARVKEVMEGVLPISVPLRVDVGVGRNWREAH
jgi:DNA polymerase-1